jgi:hypothetical protein
VNIAGAVAPVTVPVWVRIGDAEPEQVGEIDVAFSIDADPTDPTLFVLRSTDTARIREQVAGVLDAAAAKLREPAHAP